jgi:hypothetical protein
MNTTRINAIVTGALFIIATTTAVNGVLLYDPIIKGSAYLSNGAANGNQVILGALNELILACAAIGTGIMLYPHLRKHNESIALGYVCVRLLEAVVITVGLVGVLALLTVSRDFAGAAAPAATAYQATGTALLAVREWAFIIGPNLLLGVNTLLCSYLLFRTRLVPRPIAVLGLTGAVLISIAGVLLMFDMLQLWSPTLALFAAPVALYEMILALWLIAKGFNATATAPAPANVAPGVLGAAVVASRG